jgi:hypothetical protein
MRHPLIPFPTLLFLAACYDSESAPTPAASEPGALHILGGPVECDACSETRFDVAGEGLASVIGGTFVSQDDTSQTLPAPLELRRFTGDSGFVLRAEVRFTDTVRVGEYALVLRTMYRDGKSRRLTVPGAMQVTREWSPETQPSPTDSGVVRVLVTSSGPAADTQFRLDLCTQGFCSTATVDTGPVRDVQVAAPARYVVRLNDVAPNCSVTSANPVYVTIRPDSAKALAFVVVCVPLAHVRVSVSVAGTDAPQYFSVRCDDGSCGRAALTSATDAVLGLREGPHQITLQAVASNCEVSGENPRLFSAIAGDTATVAFQIACFELSTVRVSTRTTGTNSADVYTVVNRSDCRGSAFYAGLFCAERTLPAGGMVNFRAYPGTRQFYLDSVPSNCRVMGPNPVGIDVPRESTVDLVFDVTCQ